MVDELNNTRALGFETDLSEAEVEREQAARSLSEAQRGPRAGSARGAA